MIRNSLHKTVGSLLLGATLMMAAINGHAAAAAPAGINPPVLALGDVPALHDVLGRLDDHRVVLVGETHTRYDHHLVQLETLKFLHQRHGDIAVGVEWFQFPFQRHLDDYLAGQISEAQMLERTGYFERWRFDYRLYRPIVEYARQHGIPLLALNAPAELTSEIGDVGIANLPAKHQQQLPSSYDRSDQAYAERLRKTFEQHPNQNRNFEHFLEVMLTWDETMAEQAAAHLQAHPGRRMVIFAGSGHVAHRAGIPARLERRLATKTATLLVGLEHVNELQAADYAVLSTPVELPPAGLLGAFLEPGADGIHIIRLSEDSAIAAAGVAKDDVLLAIDDQPIDSYAAVKLALLDRAPGDTVQVRYRHKNWLGESNEQTVEVTLGGAVVSSHP
jgi:uncharacterized iron-regulated protein